MTTKKVFVLLGKPCFWGPLMQAGPARTGRIHTLQRKAHTLLLCELPEQQRPSLETIYWLI